MYFFRKDGKLKLLTRNKKNKNQKSLIILFYLIKTLLTQFY